MVFVWFGFFAVTVQIPLDPVIYDSSKVELGKLL